MTAYDYLTRERGHVGKQEPGHGLRRDAPVAAHAREGLGDADALVTCGAGIGQLFREAEVAEHLDDITCGSAEAARLQRPGDQGAPVPAEPVVRASTTCYRRSAHPPIPP